MSRFYFAPAMFLAWIGAPSVARCCRSDIGSLRSPDTLDSEGWEYLGFEESLPNPGGHRIAWRKSGGQPL